MTNQDILKTFSGRQRRNAGGSAKKIDAFRWEAKNSRSGYSPAGATDWRVRRKLTESLTAVPPDEMRVIPATGSYLGEGFDDARLDALLLAMPVSWRGTLQQHVGRLHRLHENKKQVQVYDYSDVLVPMLARMYKKRLAGYAALGYAVTDALDF